MTATHSRSRSFLAVAALVASLAAAAIVASLGSSPAAAASGEQTIVKTAAQAGQFDTLLALAKKAGLVGALSGQRPPHGLRADGRRLQGCPQGDAQQPRDEQGGPPAGPALPRREGQRPRLAHRDAQVRDDARRPHDRDPRGGHERLPQPLDEGRQDRHRRDERHDPRHQQGAPTTDEVSDPEPGGEADGPASPPGPTFPATWRTHRCGARHKPDRLPTYPSVGWPSRA